MSASGPIARHGLLASLSASVRATIEAAFEVRDVRAGESIIEAGAVGGDLYIVEVGWLDVLDARDGGLITQLGPGALLGELGFLRSTAANATVRATTDAVVHVLPAAAAERLAEAHGRFALALGRVAAQRVERTPEATARPSIFAVVEIGDWSAHRQAIQALLGDAMGDASHAIADLPGLGAAPGTAEHLRGTRTLGRMLQGSPTVTLWTGPDEPQLSRAVRGAGRVMVLDDPDAPVTPAVLSRHRRGAAARRGRRRPGGPPEEPPDRPERHRRAAPRPHRGLDARPRRARPGPDPRRAAQHPRAGDGHPVDDLRRRRPPPARLRPRRAHQLPGRTRAVLVPAELHLEGHPARRDPPQALRRPGRRRRRPGLLRRRAPRRPVTEQADAAVEALFETPTARSTPRWKRRRR